MSKFPTLLESGTTRAHFHVAKRLEDAADDRQRDLVVLETVAAIQRRLASQPPSDPASAASSLLPLLHCLEHYPHSPLTVEDLDISFALLPALQLISLATRWQDTLVGHALLAYLVPSAGIPIFRHDTLQIQTGHVSDLVDTQSSTSAASEADSAIRLSDPDHRGRAEGPSLLLLNTFRKHLIDGGQAMSRKSPSSQSLTTALRTHATLTAVAAGRPCGTSVLASLATPLLRLTGHRDAAIRRGALLAMWRCATYEEEELILEERGPSQGPRQGGEMLQATLQIVREMLASPQAFISDDSAADSTLDPGLERVETDPAVLRAALRVVELARDVRVLSPTDAVDLAVNALQSLEWAPVHLVASLSHGATNLMASNNRLDGLRMRAAAKARSKVAADFDYHGLRTPWAVIASLDSISASLQALHGPPVDPSAAAAMELERTLLRIYLRASEGRDAALAVCVSAACCLGHVYRLKRKGGPAASSSSPVDVDGETAALWLALSEHVKHQLGSTNANRKVAAIRLLSALEATGWASAVDDTGSPFSLGEREMAALMSLLADRDETVRRAALRLLDAVDAKIVDMHLDQLVEAISVARARSTDTSEHDAAALLERALEASYIKALNGVIMSGDDGGQEQQGSSYAQGIVNILATAKDAQGSSLLVSGAVGRVLNDYRGLPSAARLSMLLRLIEKASQTDAPPILAPLAASLCCDLEAADLAAGEPGGSSASALGSLLATMLDILIAAEDDRTREALLAAIARVAALSSGRGSERDESLSLRLRKVAEATSATRSAAFRIQAQAVAQLLQPSARVQSARALIAPAQTPASILDSLLALGAGSGSSDSANDDAGPGDAPSDRAEFGSRAARGKAADAASTARSHLGRSLIRSPLDFSATASSHASASPSRQPLRFQPECAASAAAPRKQQQQQQQAPPRALSASSSSSTRPQDRSSSNSSSSSKVRSALVTSTSAIPSRAKRERDSRISSVMSSSIARLVMGDEGDDSGDSADRRREMEDTVVFSASAEGIEGSGSDADLPTIAACNDAGGNDPFAIHLAEGEQPSFLDILHQCHNCDPWADDSLHPFVLDGVQIGFLRPEVLRACEQDIAWRRKEGKPAVLLVGLFGGDGGRGGKQPKKAITFDAAVSSADARTAGMASVTERWRDLGLFPDPLEGWRNELYAVYGAPSSSSSRRRNEIAFKLERAACALFGVATFGVHLTAYTPSYQIWVPRRSATKSTWPGYLDNSVAGGIVAGDEAWSSMVRECEEEASLDAAYVEERCKTVGVLSYFYKTRAHGWIQPEVEYVYDLCVEEETVLRPCDGEAESFVKMPVDEVVQRIKAGEFKPNCCLVLLDFFIRHNLITPEREPAYRAIVAQLHTDLRLPGP
ncbi:uncharacterized protein PFL1_01866 [Pseudozyma flocculosa PF-1]|uniref:Nudix hydrolase domain-containing protein n=1 Tax=Pseudozyma flocculosa TaxID=84751 RepID=A0A5C3F1P4_9BASI|nr:uncharacterized protein PFL1_01866 [Pseudozyma flocculosa PF-1]EPQ30340.1 hypothetical protein PFL1_01866 [Pseudozyma flocculosa PF-1]SPO37409.1 uncharacterized protein PSFLO_02882 [Pseudozyma flocculosa]